MIVVLSTKSDLFCVGKTLRVSKNDKVNYRFLTCILFWIPSSNLT